MQWRKDKVQTVAMIDRPSQQVRAHSPRVRSWRQSLHEPTDQEDVDVTVIRHSICTGWVLMKHGRPDVRFVTG